MKTKIKFRILFLLILSMNAIISAAQTSLPDSANTYFAELWRMHQITRPLNYFTVYPLIKNEGRRLFPSLLEASLNPYYIIARGRDNSRPSIRSSQLAVNVNLGLRMYSYDAIHPDTLQSSFPVRPLNLKAAIIFTKYLHNNKVVDWPANAVRSPHFVEIRLAHYSNGQAGSPFNIDSNGKLRVNYVSGNFSTNYAWLGWTYARITQRENIVHLNPYLQVDGAVGGPLSFDDSQLKSYGQFRTGMEINVHTQGRYNRNSKGRQIKEKWNVINKFKSKKVYTNFRVRSYYTFEARFKYEHIWGDLSNYTRMQKSRNSIQIDLIARPESYRNIAYYLGFYTGRDYLNIRYHDQILQLKAGIIANTDFYKPRNTRISDWN